jgi:small conductance mechanosensitive channel
MDTQAIKVFLSTTAIDLGIKILAALAFWFVGRWLINRVAALIRAAMGRNNVDPTLTKYLGSIVTVTLNIALVLGILGYFGVETTSFAALLAGVGLAIGAAWSGMLGNFAAGAFMLVLRPFKVGDAVSVGGVTGTVQELGLFGTTIVTPDNVLTVVGNGKIFADTIQNFSALPVRRHRAAARRDGDDSERRDHAGAADQPARHDRPGPGHRGAAVHAQRPLLAGVLRHQ